MENRHAVSEIWGATPMIPYSRSYSIVTQSFCVSVCASTGNYGEELAKVIRDVLLVSEVAGLAMHLEKRNLMDRIRSRQDALTRVVGDNALDHPDLDVSATMRSSSSVRDSLASEDKRRNPYNGSLSQSQKNEIMSLLESWDEPETAKTVDVSQSRVPSLS